MKSITQALENLFDTGQYQFCGMYQFSLTTGGVLYYSSGDVDIKWNGNLYSCGGTVGPFFDRSANKLKMHQKVGIQVDSVTFDVLPGTSTVQGIPFLQAVKEGIFDGATVVYSSAYWAQGGRYANPITPVGVIDKMEGLVAEVDEGRSLATFTVNDFRDLLTQNWPRNLYQSGCLNTLYDAGCTLNANSFKEQGIVVAGSTASVISASLAAASGAYTLGYIKFTSGVNSGISRSVGLYTKGSPGPISLSMPFPNAPSAGDVFTIYQGCDKSQATCQNKFNNLIHYRGFPYVPENSTAA